MTTGCPGRNSVGKNNRVVVGEKNSGYCSIFTWSLQFNIGILLYSTADAMVGGGRGEIVRGNSF